MTLFSLALQPDSADLLYPHLRELEKRKSKLYFYCQGETLRGMMACMTSAFILRILGHGPILFDDLQLGRAELHLNGPFESAAGAELEEVHLGVTSSIAIIHFEWL